MRGNGNEQTALSVDLVEVEGGYWICQFFCVKE